MKKRISISNKENKNSLIKFAGLLSKEEGEKIKKRIYEERKISSKRFNC